MKLKSLKSNILFYLVLFSSVPLIIASSILLYEVYESKMNSLFHKHNQILKQVIYESDEIIRNIEYLGEYVKEEFRFKKHDLLTELVKVQNNITTVLILDNNGILQDFASSQKINMFKGYDYSNRRAFEAIENGKKSYWTEVYLSHSSSKLSISYALRIGVNKIAVLIIGLEELEKYTEKFKGENGESMIRITDKNGIFISHPTRKNFVLQRKSIKNTQLYRKYIVKNYKNKQIFFSGYRKIENVGLYGVTNKLSWNVIVREKSNVVFANLKILMIITSISILLLLLLTLYFSLKLSKSILKPLDELNEKMEKITHDESADTIISSNYLELKHLSSNFIFMKKKLKDKEDLNRKKDKQIYDSQKMSQMGEMIGNIAHQWRQPLSVISTSASGMKMENEFGLLDDDKFIKYCDMIVDNTQFLSETIDTFRNFIKENKDHSDTVLTQSIDKTLTIVKAVLETYHIKVIKKDDYDSSLVVNTIVAELSQVMINVINNAKDILLEKNIKDPWIAISCFKEGQNAVILIEDNAGGIPSDVLPKIFDPYFTTKYKSQGTGLGLHMSYKIMNESLNGSISASNSKNGALFKIELPLLEK